MRGIFISYRREDTEGQAGRLFDDLSAHYGADAVFMDVAGIKKGLDFRRIIQEHVTSCGVLLVIIGKGWLNASDSAGKRRLDDPNDFVRLETVAALSRDIPVVPVLVHGASMPREDELPQALRDLAFRNGTEISHARWDSDVKLLIDDLKPYLQEHPSAARGTASLNAPDSSATPSVPSRPAKYIARWAALGGFLVAVTVTWLALPPIRLGQVEPTVAPTGGAVQTARVEPRQVEPVALPPVTTVSSAQVPDETTKAAAAAAQAAAAKAAAARAARAAAARKEAEDQRRREDAAVAAQRAEEQRRRDEDARKLAQEQAEKDRQAAEQAAAARVFTEFATAIIGSRQGQRR